MPGYSIQIAHKAPKTITPAEHATCRTSTRRNNAVPLPAKELITLPGYTGNSKSQFLFPHQKITSLVYSKNKTSNLTASSKNEAFQAGCLNAAFPEAAPSLFHKNKEVCSQSKTSQTTGMLALTITLFSIAAALTLIALKNSGGYWATVNLAVPVVVGGAISGGILGLLAIIFAISAFHKIHQNQDQYTGTGKAVTGIVFATILYGILALMVIA